MQIQLKIYLESSRGDNENTIFQILKKLQQVITEVCGLVSTDTSRVLIASLPEQMKERLSSKGAATKY